MKQEYITIHGKRRNHLKFADILKVTERVTSVVFHFRQINYLKDVIQFMWDRIQPNLQIVMQNNAL